MKKAILYYDGDCPFCNRYSKLQELRECIDLELKDARIDQSYKQIDQNINLDDGVILVIKEPLKLFQGVEAINYLDKICRFKTLLFKIQKLLFKNKFIATIIYGVLKFLRSLFVK